MKQFIASSLSVVLLLGFIVPMSWAGSAPQTQPISAATLPLPTGASTESTVSTLSGKFPAAAALANSTANPTLTGMAAYLMCFNGTTWDRCQGGTVDTDDGSVAGSQIPNLGINLLYGWNGATWGRVQVDPCAGNTKQFAAINGTAGATIITGTSSKKIYVCSLNLVTATTQNINLVSGTGTVCATGTTAIPGLAGGTTAAAGWNFAANGGIAMGSGSSSIAQVANSADNLCLLMSSSGQISGGLSYVVQ